MQAATHPLNAPPAHILIVDDEGLNRYSISKSLQKVGYEITEASTGLDALDHLRRSDIDVVLTDIKMPEMDGVELLRKIRGDQPEMVVILMTGYASLPSAVEALRLGAYDYFIKPGSMSDLRNAIARGVEKARNNRRRKQLLDTIRSDLVELTRSELEPVALSMGAATTEAASPQTAWGEQQDMTAPTTTMRLGPLTVYPGRYQISVGDISVYLTPTEFDLLMYLGTHSNRVVPCHELVREVRSYAVDEAEAREVIRPHISNLRRKLKTAGQHADIIVNVRGIGYRLNDRVR
jgi:DNA-binding response OmpR family regulator